MKKEKLTYLDSGVNRSASKQILERVHHKLRQTLRSEVIDANPWTGFGALFALGQKYRNPVLVSGTDGVGSKLMLAQQLNRHETIGIDLVAMCVNDILVYGAEPLFFLDYFASGELELDKTATVLASLAQGCELAGCALVGGETAQMPGMYVQSYYDLAGFCVGAVERDQIIDGSQIEEGDLLIGLASSGLHSNGYSLVRHIIDKHRISLDSKLDDLLLADVLMQPTTLYVKPVLAFLREYSVHGMAHITGGGLYDNIIRVVPEHLGITINTKAWPKPKVFEWIEHMGPVSPQEMWRTFNCGIGYVLVVSSTLAQQVLAFFEQQKIDAWVIGSVVSPLANDRVHLS